VGEDFRREQVKVAGGNGKRGGGDRVLESRHLVGLFLGVVLLCGVFFTLGYVMGRTQSGMPMPLHASADSGRLLAPGNGGGLKAENPDAGEKTANSEWDFYSKGKDPNKFEPLPPGPNSTAANPPANSGRVTSTHRPADSPPAPAPASAPPSARATQPVVATPSDLRRFQAPRIPRGSVVMQIAALTKESDALAMADAAQQKHFPSFVVTASNDRLFRVQVGPYPEGPAAEKAKAALAQAGFKPIIKR
jgi:DedD protein